MLFKNLYNRSFFMPKLLLHFAASLDKEAEDIIDEAEKEETKEEAKEGHNKTKKFKDAMEGDKATTLENMRARSANIRTRLKEGKNLTNLTKKGFVGKLIDEKAEEKVRERASYPPPGTPEKIYLDKVALLDGTFTAKIKGILGLSMRKYALLTEKISTCNTLIADLNAQINAAQDLQGFYKSAREYCQGRGFPFGRLKFPLRGLVVDPLHYKENQEMLRIVQEIQRDTRMKKTEYDRKIQEKFNQEYKLEGNLRNILLRYNPKLTANIEDILEKNAMGDGKDIKDVIEDLENNHSVSKKEANALRAMAGVLQSKKASKAKAFEIAGRESVDYEKIDQILANMGKLKKGNKFKLTLTDGKTQEYTALRVEQSKDNTARFLTIKDSSGIATFILTTDKIYKKTKTKKKEEIKDLKLLTVYK